MTNLLARWALELMIEIAEATLGVTDLVYGTWRVILAKDPAFPLRKARLRSVVACLVGVARFHQGIRAIGEAQIKLRIAPEVGTAFTIRIARAEAILMQYKA